MKPDTFNAVTFLETLPSKAKALAAIENARGNNESVFDISPNAVRLAWERLKKGAGITHLRFHDLRHEAISRLFEKGLTVPEVASISGHKTPSMLFRYAHADLQRVTKMMR